MLEYEEGGTNYVMLNARYMDRRTNNSKNSSVWFYRSLAECIRIT